MSSAAQRVFAVPELLDNILRSLIDPGADIPGHCLYTVQRVGRTFHACVNNSAKLQEAMLLKCQPFTPSVTPVANDFYALRFCMEKQILKPPCRMKLYDIEHRPRGSKIRIQLWTNYMCGSEVSAYFNNFIRPRGAALQQPRPSWYRMKLCRYEIPIKINVNDASRSFEVNRTVGDLIHLTLSVLSEPMYQHYATVLASQIRRRAEAGQSHG